MTLPTSVAPDDARHDYIARVYKMTHAELFAELMRVHTEANRLVNEAVAAERQECCNIVTGLCLSDNNAEEINKVIRSRGTQKGQA